MDLRSAISATESEGTGSGVEREEGGKEEIGVLDVVKAIAPLLVIIGLALGMLVLGYMFVPEILTTPSCTLVLSLSFSQTKNPCSLFAFTLVYIIYGILSLTFD